MRAITRLIAPLALSLQLAGCADGGTVTPVAELQLSPPGATVVVGPENAAGWTLRVGGSSAAGFEATPADRLLGKGSVGFAIGTSPSDEVSLRNESLAGTRLAELKELRYSMRLSHLDPGAAAPFVMLPVDLNNDGFIDDHLLFRPTPALNSWQSWDALRGGWWSTSEIGAPDERGIRSLAAYVAAMPDARIASALVLGAWDTGGKARVVGSLDAVVIGVGGRRTTYDFEP